VPVAFTHLDKKRLRDISQCASWAEPYIMMGGYTLPCCGVLMSNRRDFLRQHCFSNIFEKPFKRIWSSERYKKFRQMVNKKNATIPLLCVGCRGFDTSQREKKYGIDKNV